MLALNLLREEDIAPLAEGVCVTLEKVGVLCQNADLLRSLREAGAVVDFQYERAWFPRRMTEAFVEALRREAPAPQTEEPPVFRAPAMPGVGLQIAQFYYDYETARRRSGNRSDLITLVKFGSALHPDQGAGHALVLSDVPASLEPLEAGLLLAEYTTKPQPPFAWRAEQIPWLREMGEVLGLDNWFAYGATAFAHPLRMEKVVADKFVLQVRSGAKRAGLTAMPIAGVTTPVTIGGFVVVSAAEQLATWMAARALNPAISLGGSIWPGTVDMKTGAVSYCAFDALWYGFATAAFLRRWCNFNIQVSGGDYCDAKFPGWFAVLEKAYKVMTLAAFTGRHGGIGSGMLEEGKTISPVQLLLERDFTGGVRFYAGKPDFSEESLAMSAILEAGLCLDRNYLELEHTARHFRHSLWLPEFYDRAGWAGCAHEEAMLRKAQARVRELLASYRKPEVDPDKLEKLRAIVRRARKALL